MRLFLDTLVRWIIAAGLYLGAIGYFSVLARTPSPSAQLEPVAVAIVAGAIIVVSAFAFRGIYQPLCVALCLSLAICAYYDVGGTLDFGWKPLNALATIVLVLAILLMTIHLIIRTHRFLSYLTCSFNPEEVERHLADLVSPDLAKKSLAVQTIADYLGLGIAGAENLPFTRSAPDELEIHADLIKKIWDARQAALEDCPSQKRLLRDLGKYMKESFARLARWDPTPERGPESFKTSPPANTDSLPQSATPSEASQLIEAMLPRITETLHEAARIINEAPAGSLVVDCEEPVGELLAQLLLQAYQVDLSFRFESSDIKRPVSLSDASVWRLSDGGFLTIDHLFEQAGAFLRDALVKLNLLAEEVHFEPNFGDPPPMTPDEYLVTMLPHVERALESFAEIMNQSPTGLITVAEEPRLCRLFAKLHAQALETGLELRVKRAETLGLAEESSARRATSSSSKGKRFGVTKDKMPHLRKAASPPLPSSILGWAQKYRHMRIAGTRIPLIREDLSKSEKAHSSDDPTLTSIKQAQF
jgi:hypothetical protein